MEEREKAKNEEKAAANGQSDVASILARRVAVEMSDSDDAGGGPSDSEYDSDDWDESTAWQKMKHLRKIGIGVGGTTNVEEYFFKSQESLATVIDQTEDEADDAIAGKSDDVIKGQIVVVESVAEIESCSPKKLFQRMSSVWLLRLSATQFFLSQVLRFCDELNHHNYYHHYFLYGKYNLE